MFSSGVWDVFNILWDRYYQCQAFWTLSHWIQQEQSKCYCLVHLDYFCGCFCFIKKNKIRKMTVLIHLSTQKEHGEGWYSLNKCCTVMHFHIWRVCFSRHCLVLLVGFRSFRIPSGIHPMLYIAVNLHNKQEKHCWFSKP